MWTKDGGKNKTEGRDRNLGPHVPDKGIMPATGSCRERGLADENNYLFEREVFR